VRDRVTWKEYIKEDMDSLGLKQAEAQARDL